MVSTTRVNLIVLPLVALLGISASLLGDAAKAFPVDSPSSFKSYLNSESALRDGYKIKFNSVSECYRTYKKKTANSRPTFAKMARFRRFLLKENVVHAESVLFGSQEKEGLS